MINTTPHTHTRTRTAGICVVPGSGFGQRDGKFHFRTTFLPQEEQIRSVVDAMAAFHARFMDQWRD